MEIDQFGEARAFEEIAGSGGYPSLKLRAQAGCDLNASMDLFLNLRAEPRHRQVCDMHGLKVGN